MRVYGGDLMKVVLENELRLIKGASKLVTKSFVAKLQTEFPDIEFIEVSELVDILEACVDAEIYFGWPESKVFSSPNKLKWVHCPGAGINELSKIPKLVDSDIVVTNAKGPHVSPMANHVFLFILSLAHKMFSQFEDQQKQIWDTAKYSGSLTDLEGQSIGIFGFGDIGKAVAKRALSFGMRVIAVDAYPKKDSSLPVEVMGFEGFDIMFKESDWLVITAPYTEKSRGVIGKSELNKMKKSANIIIISRGGIVEESALYDSLKEGKLAGAAFDAFEKEPLDKNSPFWKLPNVIISPHVSAEVPGLYAGRQNVFINNLKKYINNEPLINICNKKEGF